jgi:hypothetical protein
MENVRIKCRVCRNAVIESSDEGAGKLVTRYKQLQRVNGIVHVQCRKCGNWIQIPKGVI